MVDNAIPLSTRRSCRINQRREKSQGSQNDKTPVQAKLPKYLQTKRFSKDSKGSKNIVEVEINQIQKL